MNTENGHVQPNLPVCCNACGRQLKMERGILLEDAFEAKKEWGYFSRRDLEVDRFVLCEDCYDKITKNFIIPIRRENKQEVL